MEDKFIFQIRTRYGETDQMGVIYYGVYPQYLEVARVEISYKKLEEMGIMLPVVSLHIDYKRPAVYDELLSIETSLREKPTSKIIFDYQIFNENKDLIISANTTLVFVDKVSFKPIKCPTFILEKILF